MKKQYGIFVFSLIVLFCTGCRKDKMPNNSSGVITEEYMQGNWIIESTKSYLKVSDIMSMYSDYCEKLLNDKLSKVASGKILYFTDHGKAYCIDEGVLKDSSDFHVDEETNTLYFDSNPKVLGFYIPHFYMKKNEQEANKMTGYLGKKESMDVLENDGTVETFYMNLIKNNIKDAQCEIRFKRDFTDYSYLQQ